MALFHQIRFHAGDPVSLYVLPNGQRHLIIRDVELERAKRDARADVVNTYEAFEIEGGLSSDRAVRVAQATAEALVREGVTRVDGDRSLQLLVVEELGRRGIEVACDVDFGVIDRRQKTEEEVAWLRHAQSVTEEAMRFACELIGGASVLASGELEDPDSAGRALTSEAVRRSVTDLLKERGFHLPTMIASSGPASADCHNRGSGPIRTGELVVVDIFPQDTATGYWGDCTRGVVNGEIPDEVARMHAAVAEAKAASIAACSAKATGHAVHRAGLDVLERHGFERHQPPSGAYDATEPTGWCGMTHGTGHGIGLEVHEPPLLDEGVGELVVGDALTIEPGLYAPGLGGVRLEDMVIVTADGCENLNRLPDGLTWA